MVPSTERGKFASGVCPAEFAQRSLPSGIIIRCGHPIADPTEVPETSLQRGLHS